MPLDVVGTFSLGQISLGTSLAAAALVPMAAQLDAALFGPVGVGSFQAEVQGSLNASLGVSAQLQLAVTNPIASYQATLASITQLVASISAALAAGAPTIGAEISVQLSASAALSGTLSGRLGAMTSLMQAAALAKTAGFQVAGEIQASLSAGGVGLLSFGFSGPITLQDTGAQCAATFGAGIPGILPSDPVYGVMVVTKDPTAVAAIQALFRTG